MNRNKIIANGEEQRYLLFLLIRFLKIKKINEHYISSQWSTKLIRSIQHNYQKSPYFEEYSVHLFFTYKRIRR